MGRRASAFGLALTRPGELVALALAFGHVSQKVAQRIEVHSMLELTIGGFHLGHRLREQLGNLLDVLDGTVGRA